MDVLSFNQAVSVLCNFGLVEPDRSPQQQSGSRGYSMHSCVHSWAMFVLNQKWNENLARLALTCVASEIPSSPSENSWLLHRRLLHHVATCEKWLGEKKIQFNKLHWVLHQFGLLDLNQSKLNEAEHMLSQAMQKREDLFGANHESTLDTTLMLGHLYKDQGRLTDAEAKYDIALRGYMEMHGSKHISTLQAMGSLGALYVRQGKLAEAEAKQLEALRGKVDILSPNHVSTLATLHNLGTLYKNQGRMDEAEVMYMRALEGKEKVLGSKHTSTLLTVQNLGSLYAAQGKLDKAETMYVRALEGNVEALGPKHTSTLSTFRCLDKLYADQGRAAITEANCFPLYRDAAESWGQQRLFVSRRGPYFDDADDDQTRGSN